MRMKSHETQDMEGEKKAKLSKLTLELIYGIGAKLTSSKTT